jgi:hypothetical protein
MIAHKDPQSASMRSTLLPLVLGVLLGACRVAPESLVPHDVAARAPLESEHLRGTPRAFVVLGGERSFAWPALLQELLDDHANRSGLYRVLNAATDADGIHAWSAAEDGGPLDVLGSEYLASERPGKAPLPRTALCMVSLRGLSDARGPVKTENDMVGAEMGADALEGLARELHAAGIETVVFATRLYAEGCEPELGLERIAIERLLARGLPFVEAGPDVFGASRPYFPDAYESDLRHPNEFGVKLVAEEWYRWLAGPEAHEAVVEALYAEDFDMDAIEAAHAERLDLARP